MAGCGGGRWGKIGRKVGEKWEERDEIPIFHSPIFPSFPEVEDLPHRSLCNTQVTALTDGKMGSWAPLIDTHRHGGCLRYSAHRTWVVGTGPHPGHRLWHHRRTGVPIHRPDHAVCRRLPTGVGQHLLRERLCRAAPGAQRMSSLGPVLCRNRAGDPAGCPAGVQPLNCAPVLHSGTRTQSTGRRAAGHCATRGIDNRGAGRANIRREEGGSGGGGGSQKFVHQNWPDQVFPLADFV